MVIGCHELPACSQTPEQIWERFTEVPEDEGQLGITAEHTANNQPKHQSGDIYSEAPRGTDQFGTFPICLPCIMHRKRWMQIERDTECFGLRKDGLCCKKL